MDIRRMREEDLETVASIEKEIFSQPWSEEDFRQAINHADNLYIVAELDGVIVGYCGYWGIVDEGNIYNVAVREEFRGKNIGYSLLVELIRQGMAKNIGSFTLEVRSSNTSAINLYKRLGFISAGTRKDFYTKPNEDAVIMWLRSIQ